MQLIGHKTTLQCPEHPVQPEIPNQPVSLQGQTFLNRVSIKTLFENTAPFMTTSLYIYIYVCVCVCDGLY